LQLKNIFQHYTCYYHSHEYAFNLFQSSIISIKSLWRAVCIKIKHITIRALDTQKIEENEFLLIKEAEETQDQLIEFVYGERFALKLPKELRLNQINLLKPEVSQYEIERKKRQSAETVLCILQEKKQRKPSIGSLDTDRSSKRDTPHFKLETTSAESHREKGEEKLNTEEQIEILDCIHELENMLQLSEA
jgi:hypothetical protein